ncbi:secreted and transmembrane protein 1 [Saccopteryx leptura]|uniref:secreted and transmembrane protein 1 n=1 Tax=Saccopteryx leptura TaxID=249018 RepID=UPI00339D2E79
MLTSAPSLPVPIMLWTLVLMLVSLSSQMEEVWDQPTCTKGAVSVTRGERAVMTYNTSSSFHSITICQIIPNRTDCQLLFKDMTLGNISQDGWQLCVQETMAQLVIEKVQDTQAGQYKWIILKTFN